MTMNRDTIDPKIIDGTLCCLCKIYVPSKRKTNLNGKSTSAIETRQYFQQFLHDVLEANIASTKLYSDKIGLCCSCIDQVRKMKVDELSLKARKSRLKDQLAQFVERPAAEASAQSGPLQRRHSHSVASCD